MLAREGDSVAAGAILVRLDDAEPRAALAAAEAQLALREAGLAKLRNGATTEQRDQARAAVDAAAAQLTQALNGARDEEIQTAAAGVSTASAERTVSRRELERIHNLDDQGGGSARQLDQARAARDAAEARYRAASGSGTW